MTSHKTKKQYAIENKTLLAQLPYYICKVLTSTHPQFNSLIDDNRPSRKLLDSLSSLYDLSVFQLNSLDKHIDPDINLTSNKIRSKYYSPHSFAQFIDSKQLQSKISFLRTNIRSLKKNFEEFQHHDLSEMNFRFTIINKPSQGLRRVTYVHSLNFKTCCFTYLGGSHIAVDILQLNFRFSLSLSLVTISAPLSLFKGHVACRNLP